MAVHNPGSRLSCLIVLPSCAEGVSAQSFIQCFTLTHSAFVVQLATPGGKTPEFINQDEQSRRWLNDFRTKPFAVPLSLEIIDHSPQTSAEPNKLRKGQEEEEEEEESCKANRYTCLLIPHSPGAAVDLYMNKDLGQILLEFIRHRKFICAIGLGVAGLFSAKIEEDKSWGFKTYSLTGSSVFELAQKPNFSDLAVIPEDAVRDGGGCFSNSGPECVHVVVDRHLVTGQNEQSTLTAVQNLVLLCNQR
ncbi:glutamine amidotransferase-like class 1 domain-containing protein 1 isoform X2 [Anabrus simplex]|uniref:glutamine amidotransferase-like class 1 domain-containing protein 1 isoform X2 n=1 Tax=Anabrus simplex TaxID=316456 RepID=UPI0035A2C6F7